MATFVQSANPEHAAVNIDRVNRINLKEEESTIYFIYSGSASGTKPKDDDDEDPVVEGRAAGSAGGGGKGKDKDKSKSQSGDYSRWEYESLEDAQAAYDWLAEEFFSAQPAVEPV